VAYHLEGKKYADYLSPQDSGYERILLDNLINKYRLINNVPETTEALREKINAQWGFRFECQSSELRSWLQTIRKGKPDETRVRGFEYRFSLTTSPELHKIGYLTGFGEKNSMGFGCVEAGDEN
jgi:CRISPR-associated endoribonuclease Cas6